MGLRSYRKSMAQMRFESQVNPAKITLQAIPETVHLCSKSACSPSELSASSTRPADMACVSRYASIEVRPASAIERALRARMKRRLFRGMAAASSSARGSTRLRGTPQLKKPTDSSSRAVNLLPVYRISRTFAAGKLRIKRRPAPPQTKP